MPSQDPDTRNALVAAVEGQVTSDAMAQTPSEADLRKYYEANKLKYSSEGTVLLHDLVGSVSAEAVAALRGGMPVEQAEAKFGLKESGKLNGMEFYFAAKIHLGDTLFAAAAALADGQVSDVIEGHILVMQKNMLPVAMPFETAEAEVISDFKGEVSKKLQAGEEGYLRKRAEVLIASPSRN